MIIVEKPLKCLFFAIFFVSIISCQVKQVKEDAGNNGDESSLAVVSCSPDEGSSSIGTDSVIRITFNGEIDPSSLNASAVSIGDGLYIIGGSITNSGKTVTFTPSSPLSYNTVYSVCVTTGVKSISGKSLSSNFYSGFTTRDFPDMSPPEIISISPLIGSSNADINTAIKAAFNKDMNPSTLNGSTFLLKQGQSSVTGKVNYSNKTAVFMPDTALKPSNSYSVRLTTEIRDLDGNSLASNFSWNFTTGEEPSSIPLLIVSNIPENNMLTANTKTMIKIFFNKDLNPLSVNTNNIKLYDQYTNFSISLFYSDRTITITPLISLRTDTSNFIFISNEICDLSGNKISNNALIFFFTGDDTPVVVTGHPASPFYVTMFNPYESETADVTTPVEAQFNYYFAADTVNSDNFSLVTGSSNVPGFLSYDNNTVRFTPLQSLQYSTEYTFTISGNVSNTFGTRISETNLHFSTIPVPDNYPPFITGIYPSDYSSSVSVTTNIRVTFSESVRPYNITPQTFTVESGLYEVSGTITYDDASHTAIFTPNNPLLQNSLISVHINNDIADLAGNHLVSNYIYHFTTQLINDFTPPHVTAVSPANGAINVPTNVYIQVTFNENIDPSSVNSNTFRVRNNSLNININGPLYVVENCIIQNPIGYLDQGYLYSILMTSGIKDLHGNGLVGTMTNTFSTSLLDDHTPPAVSAVYPAENSQLFSATDSISITFSEPLNAGSVNSTNVILYDSLNNTFSGIISYSGRTVVFTPSNPLKTSTHYILYISTGVKDLAGNKLAKSFDLRFYTPMVHGDPDDTFGRYGEVRTVFGTNNYNHLSDMDVSSDGLIAAGGETAGEITSGNKKIGIALFDSGGLPYQGFGADGQVTKQIEISDNPGVYYNSSICRVKFHGGGLLAAINSIDTIKSKHVVHLVRYSFNGTPDTSFNNTGIVKIEFPDYDFFINDMDILPVSKNIVLGGLLASATGSYSIVLQLKCNGFPNTNFASPLGFSITNTGSIRAVKCMDESSILIAEQKDSYFIVRKIDSVAATNIRNFGFNGMMQHQHYAQSDARQFLIYTGNSFFTIGSDHANSRDYICIDGYAPDGFYNNFFDGERYFTMKQLVFPTEKGVSLTLQADGKIIAGGYGLDSSNNVQYNSAIIARFTTGGLLDDTFGNSGFIVSKWNELSKVIVTPDGGILAGATYINFNNRAFSILKFLQ